MIDWNKPVQTRDGREVRIWTRHAQADTRCPIRGEYRSANDVGWIEARWNEAGIHSLIKGVDLVNVPEKRVVCVNTYSNHTGVGVESREAADKLALDERLACIRVEYTEGLFDE